MGMEIWDGALRLLSARMVSFSMILSSKGYTSRAAPRKKGRKRPGPRETRRPAG